MRSGGVSFTNHGAIGYMNMIRTRVRSTVWKQELRSVSRKVISSHQKFRSNSTKHGISSMAFHRT